MLFFLSPKERTANVGLFESAVRFLPKRTWGRHWDFHFNLPLLFVRAITVTAARYCVFDGISSAITAARIQYHFRFRDAVEYQDLVSIFCLFVVTLLLSLTNLAFNIVLVVGIHKRDERMLRRYYFYWIFMLVNSILFLISANILKVISEDFHVWLSYHIDPVTYHTALEKPAIGAIDIVVQIYYLVLVRNLIRSLNKGDELAIIDIDYDFDNPRPRTMVESVKDVINTQPASITQF